MAVVPISAAPVQQTAPQPVYQADTAPAAAFGGGGGVVQAGQAIGRASDSVSALAAQMQVDDNERATKQADASLSNTLRTIAYGDGTAANPGYYNLQGDAALAAAPQVQAQVQQAQAAAVASLPNQRAQQIFAPVAASRASDTLAQINNHVAQQRTQAGIAAAQGRIDAATNDAAASWNDPTTLAKSLAISQDEANAIATAHGYDPSSPVAGQLVRQTQSSIYQSIFKNALAADPTGATAHRMLVQYGSQIPGDAQAAITDAITRAQKEAQTQARGQIGAAFQDNLLSIQTTGQPAVPLTAEQIQNAYPEMADRMLDQLTRARHTYDAVQGTALTSPDQDAATLASMTPAGAGFADQERAQSVVQKVISAKWSAINRDPAGYVASTAPGMDKLLAAAGSDPTQLSAYSGALDQAYDRLGVPAYNRPLLPKDAAANLVATTLSTPPEDRASQFIGMLNGYGPLKSRVLGDMVAAKLPPQYEIMAAMPLSSDRTVMASAIGNTKPLRDGLPSGVPKQIDDALDADRNLADLSRSLSYAPGGAAKAGEIVDALKPMAYALAQQGLDPASAARRAAAAITTTKYDFLEQSGGNVARVPAGQLAPTETAADDLMSSLTADHLAAPANPSGVNLTDDQLRAIALKSAQRGYWVTNESDTGLIRMNDAGLPVTLKSGKRLGMPFSYVHEGNGSVAAQQAQQQQPALTSMFGGGGMATSPMVPTFNSNMGQPGGGTRVPVSQ